MNDVLTLPDVKRYYLSTIVIRVKSSTLLFHQKGSGVSINHYLSQC